MVPALSLWLPILLSAIYVFIASSLVHMVLKYHRSDYSKVPDEDKVMDKLSPHNIPPGDYYLPYIADMNDREKPETQAKMKKGPVGFFTVTTSDYNMGASLGQWFLYCLLVSLFSAYLAGLALEPGAGFMAVFRFVGSVSLGGYFLALIQNSIWYKRAWSTTLKYLLDGFLYSLGTAAIFAWLWPA